MNVSLRSANLVFYLFAKLLKHLSGRHALKLVYSLRPGVPTYIIPYNAKVLNKWKLICLHLEGWRQWWWIAPLQQENSVLILLERSLIAWVQGFLSWSFCLDWRALCCLICPRTYWYLCTIHPYQTLHRYSVFISEQLNCYIHFLYSRLIDSDNGVMIGLYKLPGFL